MYVDAALPFGLGSALLIFTTLADGLQWVLQQPGTSFIAHYLDDFITLGPPGTSQCTDNQRIKYETCTKLGVPLATHKCMAPSTFLVFLGIEINTIAMELRLPQEKLSKLKKLLSEWQLKKVCSRKKPKSLLGHLNDACSVVKPGRLFIGRLSPFSQKQNANIETSVGLTVRPQMAAHVH